MEKRMELYRSKRHHKQCEHTSGNF